MPSPVGLALTIRLPGSGFFFFFSERAWGHPVLSRPIFFPSRPGTWDAAAATA